MSRLVVLERDVDLPFITLFHYRNYQSQMQMLSRSGLERLSDCRLISLYIVRVCAIGKLVRYILPQTGPWTKSTHMLMFGAVNVRFHILPTPKCEGRSIVHLSPLTFCGYQSRTNSTQQNRRRLFCLRHQNILTQVDT